MEITLKEVVYYKQYGIEAIVSHTRSYVRNCNALLLVTYESLYEQSVNTIQKAVHFLGLKDANEEMITKVIDLSSFDNMRQSETEKGRKFGKQGVNFTRSGKIREGREKYGAGRHRFYPE